jgi:hypothetical protein
MNLMNVGGSSDDILTFSIKLRKTMDLLSYQNLDSEKEFYEFLE